MVCVCHHSVHLSFRRLSLCLFHDMRPHIRPDVESVANTRSCDLVFEQTDRPFRGIRVLYKKRIKTSFSSDLTCSTSLLGHLIYLSTKLRFFFSISSNLTLSKLTFCLNGSVGLTESESTTVRRGGVNRPLSAGAKWSEQSHCHTP